jgi:hypothetical protein
VDFDGDRLVDFDPGLEYYPLAQQFSTDRWTSSSSKGKTVHWLAQTIQRREATSDHEGALLEN